MIDASDKPFLTPQSFKSLPSKASLGGASVPLARSAAGSIPDTAESLSSEIDRLSKLPAESPRDSLSALRPWGMHELTSPPYPKEVIRRVYDLAIQKNLKPVYEERAEQTLVRVFCTGADWTFLRTEALTA